MLTGTPPFTEADRSAFLRKLRAASPDRELPVQAYGLQRLFQDLPSDSRCIDKYRQPVEQRPARKPPQRGGNPSEQVLPLAFVYAKIHNLAFVELSWLERIMETPKVGIREFRAGLADFITAETPVAVTRHGQTVGIFIPTHGPSQADLLALKRATAKLQAVISLSEDEVDAIVADVKVERKAATTRRRG